MTCPSLRWWLMKRAAAWCGLSIVLRASRNPDAPIPVFVAFSQSDQETLAGIAVLTETFGPRPDRQDRRLHTEWTH